MRNTIEKIVVGASLIGIGYLALRKLYDRSYRLCTGEDPNDPDAGKYKTIRPVTLRLPDEFYKRAKKK